MRQFATGLNRTWLAVIGVVLLVAALFSLAVGTGVLAKVLTGGPQRNDPTAGSHVGAVFANTSAVIGLGLVGLLAALLGVGWLLAQVPRTNPAAPFRLRDDPASGLTVCAPDVFTDAVSADALTLPGVTGSNAVLRGTAAEPELTLRVTANDQTDIQALLQSLQHVVAANLQTAMGVPLHRLAVQVDISTERWTADSVTL